MVKYLLFRVSFIERFHYASPVSELCKVLLHLYLTAMCARAGQR